MYVVALVLAPTVGDGVQMIDSAAAKTAARKVYIVDEINVGNESVLLPVSGSVLLVSSPRGDIYAEVMTTLNGDNKMLKEFGYSATSQQIFVRQHCASLENPRSAKRGV